MRRAACLPRAGLVLMVLLASTTGAARTRGDRAPGAAPAGPRAAAECPAIFGGAAGRAPAHDAGRPIYWIEEEREGITVAHSSESWADPVEVELKGLRLAATDAGHAMVTVSAAVGAAVGCPAGDYALRRGDRLGRGGQVVAVLRAGVLLERAGRLAYLRAPGLRGDGPRWLVAWGAVGKVKLPEGEIVVGYGRGSYGGD